LDAAEESDFQLPLEPRRCSLLVSRSQARFFQGKLFVEKGTCFGRYDPRFPRRREEYDDLGTGWKNVVAVREKGHLKLYINGELKATSPAFDNSDYDVLSRWIGLGALNERPRSSATGFGDRKKKVSAAGQCNHQSRREPYVEERRQESEVGNQ
jgi:hypothetical protein